MRDEDSGEDILCSYCDEADDCPHRLAVIDRTFGGCTSGYCSDRYSEFGHLIEAAFRDRLKGGIWKDYSWGMPELGELWELAFPFYKRNKFVDLYTGVLTRIVIDVLNCAGGEEYPGSIEDDGGPGCSSALTLFFAQQPAEVMEAALAELNERLTPQSQPVR